MKVMTESLVAVKVLGMNWKMPPGLFISAPTLTVTVCEQGLTSMALVNHEIHTWFWAEATAAAARVATRDAKRIF
jgi:hypothetical protein